jgi:hypothetical protein
MASMLEALRKAKLVDPKKAEEVAEKERRRLAAEEHDKNGVVFNRLGQDHTQADKDEKHLQRAAKESTKPSSRVGTTAYYNRFK